MHFSQSSGTILTDIRKPIIDVDRVDPVELCKCYRTPECLRGRLLEKDDVLTESEQVLTGGEKIKAFRRVTS